MTHAHRVKSGVRMLLLLSLSTALAPVAAFAADSAEAVLARYRKATERSSEAERATHAKGKVLAFGLSGTFQQWTMRPDRLAAITTIGPFTLREGADSSGAWRVDQNGKFARRDGKDLEDAKASAWFANDMWLVPGSGGRIASMGAKSDSSGVYAVLEITPPSGRARTMWFSQKTGLLDREISKDDQRVITTRFLDYRPMVGRLRPARSVVSVEGMPMNTVTAETESIWVHEALPAAVFAPPETQTADTRYFGGVAPAHVPFRYETRHIWVKASLDGGPPEDFLVDTGASVSVIDSAYAEARGLKAHGRLQAAGAGAAGAASLTQIDSLRVEGWNGEGTTVSRQTVAILSLNPYLEPYFWRRIAGILGYDFISRFVMEVDFDGRVLVLHDPKTFRYAGKGQSVPVTMAGNIPVVKAKLDGQYEGECRLDVGSGSTIDFHSPFVRKHDLVSRAGKTYRVMGGGFGGMFVSTICRMKKLEIGPYAWSDPVVILSQAETGGLASEDYAGNIGNHVLERFRCTFDYERRVVWLEPGKRYGSRDVFTRAGIQLAKSDQGFVAMQVLPGSPGARAGLKEHDRVTKLDGKPIESYSAEDVRRIFEDGAVGEKHTLEIARDGKSKRLRLVLAEML